MKRFFFKGRDSKLGKAKFLHNKFFFEDDLNPVKVIVPESKYIIFILNNEKAIGEVQIFPSDDVKIEYQNNIKKECSVKYESKVNKLKDEVTLTKKVTKGKKYELKPIDSYQSVLKLEIGLVEYVPEPSDIDELESMLRLEGFAGVFLDDNLAEIAKSEEDIELPVVVSKKAIPGKPARFELIPGIEDGKKVEKDQFFAQYVDETPGQPGYNVYGEKYTLDDLFFFPEFGPNVLIEDRGLVSLKNGRLVFNPYQIDVIEEQEIEKTINWEDGLITYEGDVVINGDIKEGGQIKCTGNLTILGGVFESYVFADGNINVKGNMDQSVVYSGFKKIAAKQIESFSLQYLVIVERIMFEASFTAQDGTNYLDKTKSLELAESEFKAIDQSIAPFISIVTQFGSQDIRNLYDKFNQIIEDMKKVALNDLSTSDEIKQEMEKFYEIIDESKKLIRDNLGELCANSANNSHLFSFKDTKITGSGTYQTNIESYHNVEVDGKCLATRIEAEHSISVNEFVPGNRNDSELKINKNAGEIKVNKLSADSIINIGGRERMIDDDETNAVYNRKNINKK